MKELKVNLKEKNYNVLVGSELRKCFASEISKVSVGKKVVVLTDDTVKDLYCQELVELLEKENLKVKVVSVKADEKSKSFETLINVYSEIVDYELNRSDNIIAFGGSLVNDIAGFVASTYMRGVGLINIPTSLMAQVDTCIGGKTAINLKQGKNLIGSFYQPKLVLVDTDYIKTLNKSDINSGLGEIIKYGCIRDKRLFKKIAAYNSREELLEDIEDIIYDCLTIKKQIIEKDEKDLKERMVLNFGHTLANAIEKVTNYNAYTHGEAVAIGMSMGTKISEEKGLTTKGTADKIIEVLNKYELPTVENFDDRRKELLDTIILDKKNRESIINLVLLEEIGEAYIYDADISFF